MRRILLAIGMLVISIAMSAAEVTEQEALQRARQFMTGKRFSQSVARRAPGFTNTDGTAPFYVFNADGQGGFVIISGDDRTVSVLGYSDSGTLDVRHLPENMRQWLEGYAAVVRALGDDVEVSRVPRRVCGEAIAPLLTSHWAQKSPFNNQCPMDGTIRSTTGCVATAMAQVMYYHQWPKDPIGAIPAYTTKTRGIVCEELPSTTFKWSDMRDEYGASDKDAGAAAVAELMRYCGQAVEMNYDSNGSGAYVKAENMINQFGYSKTARDVRREDYSTVDWEQMIYQEVASGRPVMYDGANESVGHEFIIDGYDESGLFHINWGWGGSNDGYFVLSLVNPKGRGTGGGSSGNGYTVAQGAIIGVQPDHGEPQVLPDLFEKVTVDASSSTVSRTSSTADFTVSTVNGSISYIGESTVTTDCGWALYKGGQLLRIFDTRKNVTITGKKWHDTTTTLQFGSGLADGVYEIHQIYRSNITGEFQKCTKYWNGSFLVAEISGNTLKLSESSAYNDKCKVTSVTLGGIKKVGRTVRATLLLTNHSFVYEKPFYVWLSGNKGEIVGMAASYLDYGQSGDMDIYFVPSSSGEQTMTITNDYNYKNGQYSYDASQVVWEASILIEEMPENNLSGFLEIEGVQKDFTVVGTTLRTTVTFTNNGSNNFDDEVTVKLYKVNNQGRYSDPDAVVVQTVAVAAGGTNNATFEFSDLETERIYYIAASYWTYDPSKDAVVEVVSGEDVVKLVTPTAIQQVEEKGRLDAIQFYNLQGQRLQVPRKGVNIMRLRDGTTRKVMVR